MKEIRETTEKLLKTPVEEQEHTVLPHLPTYKVGDGDFVQPIREDGQENKKYKLSRNKTKTKTIKKCN